MLNVPAIVHISRTAAANAPAAFLGLQDILSVRGSGHAHASPSFQHLLVAYIRQLVSMSRPYLTQGPGQGPRTRTSSQLADKWQLIVNGKARQGKRTWTLYYSEITTSLCGHDRIC
jgi:hypothetical protein